MVYKMLSIVQAAYKKMPFATNTIHCQVAQCMRSMARSEDAVESVYLLVVYF